jgi:1,4-alpha-glucan branching enzyme
MYEGFGAVVQEPRVTFRLFLPDNTRDPTQYARGGDSHITSIRAIGDFQQEIGQTNWDSASGLTLNKKPHPKGWLWEASIPNLPDGFYEYKYFVKFENGTSRLCSDPCSRYDGSNAENSAFVLGGNDMVVRPLANRLPIQDLIIYELMLDDFTAQYRNARAPLDAVWDKLDYLQTLGVNAIEFMPWTAWPEGGFSWGYDPYAFFTVEHLYYEDPTAPLDKLYRLKSLIDELHRRGMHVIMDGVFNHVQAGQTPDRGFPYFWLYRNPSDSPYIGDFEGTGFFNDLDYANNCTAEFIVDACKYWIDEYKIDGIRFDYALGYFDPQDPALGIARVVHDLQTYTSGAGNSGFIQMLELMTDNRYDAINDTNTIGADGCWFDPILWESIPAGQSGTVTARYHRALDAGKDFQPNRQPVTYIENHDHSTITEQCGGRNVWWTTQPLAIALLSICGAPLIHNGQEFGEQYWFPESGNGRVMPRPLRWERSTDASGVALLNVYRQLIGMRKAHPALRSQNFYPPDDGSSQFNSSGYGIDASRGLAIFHRWADAGNGKIERFIIALNFTDSDQWIDVPFSVNGQWNDLLNNESAQVTNYSLRNTRIPSHWGRVYWNVE